MSTAAFCRPRRAHGLQAMMLQWERWHPVNAIQFARLDASIAAATIASAADRVFRRLTGHPGAAPACQPTGDWGVAGEGPYFAFQHQRFIGDWRTELERAVTSELNRGYSDSDPPWRILLLESAQDGQFLGLGYRHVIADARSISLLLHEIIRYAVAPSAQPSGCEAEVRPESLRTLYAEEFRWRRIPAMAWNHARELWASRRAFRPPCADPRDLRMEFLIHGDISLKSVKDAARSHDATINDLVFAAILEWMAGRFPAERRGSRRDLAVAALADLSSRATPPLPRAFGQYLSQFAVRLPAVPGAPFAELVQRAATASRMAKRTGRLIDASRGFELIAKSWERIPILRRPGLLPAMIPILAGVSNVHLGDVARDPLAASVIGTYLRGTCVTDVLPMMVSLTTVGDTCTMTTTHRPAVFSSAEMRSLVQHLKERLAHGRTAALPAAAGA